MQFSIIWYALFSVDNDDADDHDNNESVGSHQSTCSEDRGVYQPTRKATLQRHFSCNFPLTLLLLFTLSPLNNNSQTLEDDQEPTKSERRDCVKIEPKVPRKKCKTPNIEKSLDVFCKKFTQTSRKKLNGKSSFLQHLQSKRVTWIEISL